MTLAQFAAFVAVLVAALAVPGPAMLVALRNTLVGGRASGVATGLGLASMATCWTLAALLGLGALLVLLPWLFGTLKLLGALYLIWIAVQTWRAARAPLDLPLAEGSRRPLRRAALSGVLVNLANPKSILFAGSVLVVIFPQGLGPVEAAVVLATHFTLEVGFYALIAVALSRSGPRAVYARARLWIDRTASVLMGALGLRLLLAR